MTKTLTYLFDPLCGWCYGAAPTLATLHAAANVDLVLLPTGLFADDGARPMTPEFAAYAWRNDTRIAELTGQHFSQEYRQAVLGDVRQAFDSSAATLALTAVSLTEPQRELEALSAIQTARFVDGQDISQVAVLVALLGELRFEPAAKMLRELSPELHYANRERIEQAQALMRAMNASGVPTLIASDGTKQWRLDTASAYGQPNVLLNQLSAPESR